MSVAVASLVTRGLAALDPVVESARADVYLLLARALDRDRAWILAHGEALVAPAQAAAFDALCGARATGRPMAYVLGSAGFYGREFAVDERVLVPRPETEHLVDAALEFLRAEEALTPELLDVGTGSGAIACTMAAEVPWLRVTATDVSAEALAVAVRNARRLGVAKRCTFLVGDLAAPARDSQFDVVVANLPYVATSDMPQRPDPIAFEPRCAIDGGADGLSLYRRLFLQLRGVLKNRALVLLEAAPPVMEGLVARVRGYFPETSISVHRDYAGNARYVKMRTGA